eukprot:TRINITY_DN15007_c1_g1_i1.p1 TRINITY_DN15007_c1_g1~~TRINITY_DN15007_c1_g1_i1.p1  ORF type:complete len:443 (+),score=49.83 TRINITY_DN15007_c1_g1_i1:1074-2402(+)
MQREAMSERCFFFPSPFFSFFFFSKSYLSRLLALLLLFSFCFDDFCLRVFCTLGSVEAPQRAGTCFCTVADSTSNSLGRRQLKKRRKKRKKKMSGDPPQDMRIRKLRSTEPSKDASKINGIAMSSRNNGLVVSWSDTVLQLWGYPQLLLISKIECQEVIEHVAVEKKVAVLHKNGILQLYDLTLKAQSTHSNLTRYRSSGEEVSLVVFLEANVVLCGYRESPILFLNIESDLAASHDIYGGSSVGTLTRDNSSRTVIGTVDGHLHLLTQSALLSSVKVADNKIASCALAGSGSVAVCVCGGSLFVINIKRDSFITSSKKSILSHNVYSGVSCSSDGNLLACTTSATLQLIRVRNLPNAVVECRMQDSDKCQITSCQFVPHLVHVQHHLLKDADYRSTILYAASNRMQTLEVCDPNHILWSKAVLLSTLLLVFAAAVFAIITP